MKIWGLITLFISIQAAAGEFYAYHSDRLPSELNPTPVYTEKERKLLQDLVINYQVSKVKSELKLHELKKRYPGIKFEKVHQIEFYDYPQWHLKNNGKLLTRWITDIDTEQVQAIAGEDIQLTEDVTNEKIRVAVIDSGIDTTHPDLKNIIVRKENECQALEIYKACTRDSEQEDCDATIDTDGDGYPMDCTGWSMTNSAYPNVTVSGNPIMIDTVGHGTHIAGIIGAEKNQFGVNGVASNVEILPVQVAMDSTSDSPIDNIAKGVLYAIQNKAQVINLSLGWRFQFDSQLMRDMVKAAVKRDIAIIVAAGNDSHSDISYPCAYEDVICVAAHDQTGNLASYSNRGTSVDLIAPGSDILSTWPTNMRSRLFTQDYNYEYMSGTSQAAPIVAGALARLMGTGLTSNQAKIKILKGARSKKEKSDIRFGNLDYRSALAVKSNDLLYPQHKEAALIVYKQESSNSVRIKLKNLGQNLSHQRISLVSQSNSIEVLEPVKKIDGIESNEVVELDFALNITDYSESEHRFILQTPQQNYIVRANIIRPIQPDSQGLDSIALKTSLPTDSVLKPFDDYTNSPNFPDFLAVNSSGNATKITMVQFHEGAYRTGRSLPIRDANPVFLNFSKVDVDKDQLNDYVITYVTSDREGNKTTKFLLFNADLTPKRYLLSPGNSFDNIKTFLPGKYKWMSLGNRLVPAWIGLGENGSDIPISPWEPKPNTTSNYLYYLDAEKGLQHITLPEDVTPLHMLYQGEKQLTTGEVSFIAFSGTGFLKNYQLYHFKDKLHLATPIAVNQYFDLFEPRPLPLPHSEANGFFNEASNGGSQIVFTLKVQEDLVQNRFLRVSNPFPRENIKFIKSVSDRFIYFQTDFKIAVWDRLNDNLAYRESKVNTRRRRLVPLKHKEGLYLPANEAPGITSEIFSVNNSGALVSLGQYRTLAIQGCEEMGLVSKHESEFIAYACLYSNKILFLPIE